MQMTLQLSETCVRYMGALQALKGDIPDFEFFICRQIEEVLRQQIASEINSVVGYEESSQGPHIGLSKYINGHVAEPRISVGDVPAHKRPSAAIKAKPPVGEQLADEDIDDLESHEGALTLADIENDERMEEGDDTFQSFLGIPPAAKKPSPKGRNMLESSLNAEDGGEDATETLRHLFKDDAPMASPQRSYKLPKTFRGTVKAATDIKR